jgi:MFS family permease
MKIKAVLKKGVTPAMTFILLMGVISLFSDMTHEGAKSLYGAFLTLAGASAAAIGFATGFGEFIGYAFRLLFGWIADKRKNYWTLMILGYFLNMAAIPALALVPEHGWILACGLIVAERFGKAMRYPSKNTLVSFASSQVGQGKGFAIMEFLDQLGAFAGPVLLFLTLAVTRGGQTLSSYGIAFLLLGIPGVLTMVLLLVARRRFPTPEDFEPAKKPSLGNALGRRPFVLFMVASACMALGFADFPMISMHVFKVNLVPADVLPLLYAGAMAADAVAALVFGWLYDKWGLRVLMVSSFLSAFFSVFVFSFGTLSAAAVGILLWGIGMGAQESILKSAVGTLVPKERRSLAFGVFQAGYGVFWFLGSWLMGALYDIAPVWLVVFSLGMQLLAVPVFYATHRSMRGIGAATQGRTGD